MNKNLLCASSLVLSAILLQSCASFTQDFNRAFTKNEAKQPVGLQTPQYSAEDFKRSYIVLGKRYYVLKSADNFVQQGVASWYGKAFHGRKTSSGAIYDMYKMTAAHKNLPLGTRVSVENLDTGNSIVLLVNDRGPFHEDRVIDLSYAAAKELGIDKTGTGRVEVRALPDRTSTSSPKKPTSTAPAPAPATPMPAPASIAPVAIAPAAIAPAHPAPPPIPVQPAPTVSSANSQNSFDVPEEEVGDSLRGTTVPIYLQLGAFQENGNARALATIAEEKGYSVIIQEKQFNSVPLYRVRLGPMNYDTHLKLLPQLRQEGFDKTVRMIDGS